MEDRKQDAIRQRLADMLDMERDIADGLASRIGRLSADRETASALERFHAVVDTHAEALAQHLKQYGRQVGAPKAASPWPSVSDGGDAIRPLSSVLRECHLAFI